ncbi:DUF3262 family protein [Hyphococcus luteus]|uniref:TIGR03758 family integrating conjugative element protein n=1 Tax=Hyphococcus luteus TaxID=2058213 RepID=A0A2S7K030_9PROT|nr:DUF3262 family protein [Marinicaulis flavus]PQA85864.1 hypothetical protein CW354_20230 [Marinicaulis flavus]
MWSSIRRNSIAAGLVFGLVALAIAEPAIAQMSAASEAEFQTGSGQAAGTMKTVIAQFVGVMTAFVIVWILFGAFQGWAKARLESRELLWVGLRISLVALFVGFFIRP